MTKRLKETEFVIFCIENVAKKLNKSGSEVYQGLKRLHAIDALLYASYETLHTQSKDYIVDEVVRTLNEWKGQASC